MKKLFILAAAIVAFASCSKEPETVINDGSIYFTNALTTRATTVTNATSLQDGFNVLGYANDLEIFGNAPATYTSEKSAWTVSPVKYWANSTNYNFFASYPADCKFANLTETAAKTSAQIVDFVNDGTKDLVLAGRNVVTAANEGRTDAAQLVFKHALSRVRFSFTNAYSNTADEVATTITVTNVALVGENKTGTVTIATTGNAEDATSSESSITWSDVDSNNSNIEFAFDANTKVGVYENGTGKNIAETKHNTTDFKYIIPAMATETEGIAYQLACKIVAYDENGNVIKEFDYTQPGNYIPLKVRKDATGAYAENKVKHEAGKSYTYNMNITSSLNDITFTVAVEDWKEENGGEIDFPGDN